MRETLPAAGLSNCLAELVFSLLSCGCGCGVRGMTEGMEEAAAEGGRSDRSEDGEGDRESSGLQPSVDIRRNRTELGKVSDFGEGSSGLQNHSLNFKRRLKSKDVG